jgi:tripartite-type tricarboxylate transporter receptor subunit TctC
LKELPDVPSFGDKGYKTGMSRGWSRLLVRKETPATIVSKLAGACEELTRDNAAQDVLRKSGLDPAYIGGAETARLAREDENAIRGFLGSLSSAK